MPSRKLALAQRWFQEVWVKGREDAIAEIMAPDAILHHEASGRTYRGPAGFRRLHRPVIAAVEDIRCDIHQSVEQGDTIALRWTFSALPRRRPGGRAGRRKRLVVPIATIVRVKDGMFVEAWDSFDPTPLNALLQAR
jgi:hypothetical protein